MTDRYCLCLSGRLGEIVLQQLLRDKLNIKGILTNRDSEEIIELSKENQIPLFVGNPRTKNATQWCIENKIVFDNILSVNYLFILDASFIQLARHYAINFHGSLLPKYRGRTPHVWAIINGEKQCGITAHLMNAECDDGDIVKQVVVPIEDDDTGAIILEKYNALYPGLVEQIISDINSGSIETYQQDISKATYFGKRTPEDGGINWNWHKERIRNWVRAQANPYPGAFSYICGKRIIINKIVYSDMGFVDTMTNGMVIAKEEDAIFVKTPNGVVCVTDYITDTIINEGDILDKKDN